MDILTAIKERKSIRAYLDKPVSREIISKILETSLRSPSATNMQPWNIYVVTGQTLDAIKQENINLFLLGEKPTISEPELSGIFRQRRIELAKDLFKLLDIAREDIGKRNEWVKHGHAYFDAPVVIFITVNEVAYEASWSLLAVGSLIQSICLAAMDYDLGTCISEQGVAYHNVLRKHIDIPKEENIAISLTLGYPDLSFSGNQLISKRTPLEEACKFIGF